MENKKRVVIQQESILERKIWYRIAKTIYIIAYILVVIVVFFFGYLLKPYTDTDPSSSVIICNNGRRLVFDDALIFKDGTLGYNDDREAGRLCSGINRYPTIKNYTVQVGYKTKGSWVDPLQFWVIGFVITFLFFEVIKRTFLYIAVGKRFLK